MIVKWRQVWTTLLNFAICGSISLIPTNNATTCSMYGKYPILDTVSRNVQEEINLNCHACTVVSEKNITFIWYHDGVRMQQGVFSCSEEHWPSCGDGLRQCDHDISIPSATVFDRGHYTCQAICHNGQSDIHQFNVQVKGPPHFVHPPSSQNISLGDDVVLVCGIESDPVAHIIWFHENGDTVHGDSSDEVAGLQTNSTVKLQNVTKNCKIFCEARNSFGCANSTIAHINVKEVPDPVKTVVLLNKTSSSVKLSWVCGFDGYSPVTSTHIMWYPVTTFSNMTWDNILIANLTRLTSERYIISNLHPATEYAIRVAVSNDQGMSTWSNTLEVKTNFTVPPAPSHVTADCFGDKMKISWSLIPDGKSYGEIKKYVITWIDKTNTVGSKTIYTSISPTTNYTFVHNSHHELPVSTNKISVCGETAGGRGPTADLIYHCNFTTRAPDEWTTATMTTINVSSTRAADMDGNGTSTQLVEHWTLAQERDLEKTVKMFTGSSIFPKTIPVPDQSVDNNLYENPVVVTMASAIVVVIICTCIIFSVYYHVKNREKHIALNIPIRAYVGDVNEMETTNEELQAQSVDLSRLQCTETNQYQTHILKLQPQNVALPMENGKLVRMSSTDEYENFVAGFAHVINLDEGIKQQLYEALIPIEKVTTGKVVGQGEFGEVSVGYLNQGSSNEVKVAIKKMKDISDSRSYETFIKEGIITTAFDHRNVLAIIGISIEEDIRGYKMPLVLMPYMENGDLRTYLYNARVIEKVEVGVDQLIGFMLDIADGMGYLASKKFVHRDLAARNCMLDSNLTVKIADFGLTRNVCGADYYRICKNGKSCKIPVKWVAIESLRDGRFTTYSDVWAYGVTMWEIITRSQVPYPGVSNCSLYEYLLQGYRLKQTPGCPDQLYTIMLSCWDPEAEKRPSFCELKERLLDLLIEWKKIGLDDTTSVDA